MLKILLSYDDKSGSFNLPHHPLEVRNFLLHVGSSAAYADLRLHDHDAPEQVQAKLIAETAADRYLQSIISPDARLSAVNTVCEQFYSLPADRQTRLADDTQITDERTLLDAIKTMREGPASAIVFSRVRLWSSDGEQCEFFMGGAPECYEDIEGHEDCVEFKGFLGKQPDADLEGITAYITTFTEGGGESQPASKDDIDRIYTAVAETDIDAITGWNWKSSTGFQFDYDMGEQPGMHEME